MTEERSTGREAQLNNIRAAVNVAESVRSTLGPAGMDKMLTDGKHTLVTNDGATILRELDVEHPGAKMVVEAAKTQEAECKDGTTSVVVLSGQMLALSEGLLMRGIHPRTVVRAFHTASQVALDSLPEPHTAKPDVELNVARTALRGKATENHLDAAAELCVKAAKAVDGDLDRIRILTQAGGSIEDSYLQEGLILSKTFSTRIEISSFENDNVLLINGGLEGFDFKEVQMQVSNAEEMNAYKQQEMQILSEVASMVAGIIEGGVVFVRDGVHEAVANYLAKQGIAVVSRLQQGDMEALSLITGLPIYHRITDIEEGDEFTFTGEVSVRRINDLDYVAVTSPSASVVTLLVRGATRQTLDEYERAFDDALGVACLVMKDGRAYPGGGASFSKASMGVRAHASKESGLSARERMCLEAYADSLEIIPAAIAANAGMDPLDVVMELRSCPENHGLYIDKDDIGFVCDTSEHGVYEPASLVHQVITSATEVATSILRIDDIIGRRGEHS
tara:strand:+ start:3252 stop:4769 length:1518 start_codon:yes stop_codon:yes gene_type:complete